MRNRQRVIYLKALFVCHGRNGIAYRYMTIIENKIKKQTDEKSNRTIDVLKINLRIKLYFHEISGALLVHQNFILKHFFPFILFLQIA